MSVNTQFVVVSYDISDDKCRRKVMKTLEDFGKRVQYSVFECNLLPVDINRLKARLKLYVRGKQDSIRFYFIGAEDVLRIQIIGNGKITQEPTYYLQ